MNGFKITNMNVVGVKGPEWNVRATEGLIRIHTPMNLRLTQLNLRASIPVCAENTVFVAW